MPFKKPVKKPFEIAVNDLGDGWREFILRGELNLVSRAEFYKQVQKALMAGRNNIVVNLDDVACMDKNGLGLLIVALHQVRSRDGDISLVCSSPRMLKAFEIIGLDKVFSTHKSLNELGPFVSHMDWRGDYRVLTLRGAEFSTSSRELLAVSIAHAIEDRRPNVVVNLDGLASVHRNGVALLLSAQRRLRRLGGDLKLVYTDAGIAGAFVGSGLENNFEHYESVNDAIPPGELPKVAGRLARPKLVVLSDLFGTDTTESGKIPGRSLAALRPQIGETGMGL